MPTYRIHPHTRERMEYLRDVASAVERAVTGESSSSVSIALPARDVAAVSEAIGEYGRILRASEDVVARGGDDGRETIERELRAARFRVTWALAHAEIARAHNERAVQMLSRGATNGAARATSDQVEDDEDDERRWRREYGDENMPLRDGYYLLAVALYNLRGLRKGARGGVSRVTRLDPECRQAARFARRARKSWRETDWWAPARWRRLDSRYSARQRSREAVDDDRDDDVKNTISMKRSTVIYSFSLASERVFVIVRWEGSAHVRR